MTITTEYAYLIAKFVLYYYYYRAFIDLFIVYMHMYSNKKT